VELVTIGLYEMEGNSGGGAKMVGKSGLLTCILDFLAVLPAPHAKSAGIILQLR